MTDPRRYELPGLAELLLDVDEDGLARFLADLRHGHATLRFAKALGLVPAASFVWLDDGKHNNVVHIREASA